MEDLDEVDQPELINPFLINPLTEAIKNRNEAAAISELERPEVLAFIVEDAPETNFALQASAAAGDLLLNFIARLLEIPKVRANAAIDDNYVVKKLSEKKCFKGVKLMLEIPVVMENIGSGKCSVLKEVVAAGDLELFRKIIGNKDLANNVEGMSSIVKKACKKKQDFMLYNLYHVLLNKNFSFIQDVKLQQKAIEVVENVADLRVLLAQLYKDQHADNKDANLSNPLYKLPCDIWNKIAEYVTDSNVKRIKKVAPICYMFSGHTHSNYLLKQAVDVVERLRNQQIKLKNS